MAWYEMKGAGLPAGLQSSMDSVLNKKWGTSTTYPPTSWPDNVNLMGPLPEKTVSGAIASFSDGADDVPLKSLVCNVDANLSGVSSVGVVHTGKNVFDYSAFSSDISGNRCTVVAENNGVTVTATANDAYTDRKYFIPVKEGATITLSWELDSADTASGSVYIFPDNKNAGYVNSQASTKTLSYTVGAGITFIGFRFGVTTSGSTLHYKNIMARFSGDNTFEPYVTPTTHTAQLGRTIYGGSVDVVNGTGTEEYTFDLWDGTQNYNVSDNLTNVSRIYMAHAKPLPDPTAVQCICEGYTFPRAGWSSDTVSFYSDANNFTLKLPKTEVTTIEQAKAWLAQHNVTFLYATTPEDFTFTPVPINSLLGDNNLWADTGDTSVTYRADIQLALNQ